MLVKVSARHLICIPYQICKSIGIDTGDYVDMRVEKHKVIMVPKQVIVEDKYPVDYLKAAQEKLSKPQKGEVSFASTEKAIKYLDKEIEK